MDVDKNEHNSAGLGMSVADRRSNVVKALTANDVIYWGADAFISVVLALFVVSFIEGATVFHVGIALMIQRAVGAISAIPTGRLFDKSRGYLDEVWGLSLACLFAGLTYTLLSFSTSVWQLYIAMCVLGICSTVNLAAWRILFYGHILKSQMGQVTGMYQMIFLLGLSLFLAVGGFAGERFGYDKVLLYGGFLMMLGSLLPLLIRDYFVKK